MEIEGDKQLSRVLIGYGHRFEGLPQPFRNSADYLKSMFSRDVFETQGAAIGERWKRLSPYTVAQKARRGYPRRRRSSAPAACETAFRPSSRSDQAVIYNTAEYFKYHQSKAPRASAAAPCHDEARGQSEASRSCRYFQEHIRDVDA